MSVEATTVECAREVLATCERNLRAADEGRLPLDYAMRSGIERDAEHCLAIVELSDLLGAAARGELPRCRWRQWCGALATKRLGGEGDGFAVCDGCFGSREHEPNDAHWHDLPHAAALRAAMAKGGAT